jgi:lipopolysaccharide transport system permease protein
LIASLLNDGGQVFISADQYIKQIRMPFTIHVLRMVGRNAIIFAHNMVVVVIVLAVFLPGWTWTLLLAIPGLLFLFLNATWLGLLLGMLCARFRDIPPIVSSMTQVAFFLTPVMWKKEMLGRYQWAADINPLYHLIEVVRAPLLGQLPPMLSWVAVAALIAVGFAVTFPLFARYRARIAYWL